MTEKRYKLHHNYNFGYGVEDTYNFDRLYLDEFELLVDELNNLNEENKQLVSVNQELRNELKFDEKMYKAFKEIIDEADDLITSHLSKHYQNQWKNFCKHRGVLDD